MDIDPLFRKKPVALIMKDAAGSEKETQMRRNLSVTDLTAFGIAAIVGAGIFSTIGTAAAQGGPAVSLLFIFTALACGFSAMSYAEFASSIPISGSAYTYAYASFGELVAWIIGWDLIMEYAVGNIAVAISWSGYFTGLVRGLGIHIPEFLSVDYLSAMRGHAEALKALAAGQTPGRLSFHLQETYLAWMHAPKIGDFRLIADLPALAIVVFISYMVYRGIREAKITSNLLVLLKLVILMVVIGVGSFYVNPGNWSPFAPNGIGGVLKGISGVFFAYIGFDAISTTAEECKNPRRDLPRSMIYALIITTLLYVTLSLVITGMVSYKNLAVSDPLAYVFHKNHLEALSGIIALGAVIAMGSVMLVFQVGQPRIWMSMSRDGLLPPRFSKLHKRFRTPAFATIVAATIVAIPALFMNLTEVTDLTSIGTLFAFVLVSGGIIIMNPRGKDKGEGGFRIPYFNSRWFLLPVWAVVLIVIFATSRSAVTLSTIEGIKWPEWIFVIVAVILSVAAIRKQWTVIPVIGLLINLFLMSELGITNWMRFVIWLVIGLVLYFSYGTKKSRLRNIDMSATVKDS
ncbi:amino acid permease [Prolixibacter sp. SD074]|uniref:amino acid permease n=1 Tax=Prolixibacter sp. SD074 TaxID=2652391 RepID=UPI001299203E|nr:amino acid permease [Prolixibacter sp. SD074]